MQSPIDDKVLEDAQAILQEEASTVVLKDGDMEIFDVLLRGETQEPATALPPLPKFGSRLKRRRWTS